MLPSLRGLRVSFMTESFLNGGEHAIRLPMASAKPPHVRRLRGSRPRSEQQRPGWGAMKRIASFAALGAAVLAVSAGDAQAQEGVFMRDLLGTLGVIPEAKPRIEYRERPTLVVPPKSALPAPVSASVEER